MNLYGLLEIIKDQTSYRQLFTGLDSGGTTAPLGLSLSARPPILARLFTDLRRPMLLVTGRVDAVPVWQQALESWLPDSSAPQTARHDPSGR